MSAVYPEQYMMHLSYSPSPILYSAAVFCKTFSLWYVQNASDASYDVWYEELMLSVMIVHMQRQPLSIHSPFHSSSKESFCLRGAIGIEE